MIQVYKFLLIPGGVPTCLKRKASLEDAFTEADTVYETPKKLRRDESVESEFQKKKSKHHQAEKKAIQDQKSKMSENDKEKGKLKKKVEKEKLKSTKPEHRFETGGSGLSSSELQNAHSQKRVKKHERKKKKSKENSKDSSKCASKNSISGNREQVSIFVYVSWLLQLMYTFYFGCSFVLGKSPMTPENLLC